MEKKRRPSLSRLLSLTLACALVVENALPPLAFAASKSKGKNWFESNDGADPWNPDPGTGMSLGTNDDTPVPKPPTPSTSTGYRGAEGVEFQPVPLDTSVNCSSIILKGTRRFQGTAFVMPRVLVSMNKQQETLFEILQTDTDKYLLRFAVYFPRTDEDLEVRMEKSHVNLNGCNFDAVVAELNRNIKEEDKKIRTLARIPVSSIDVRIDGIKKAYTVGGAESSMLNYSGSDHVVEFPVGSRKELEAIMTRIQGSIGLGIHVAMKFSARSADGALYADVDLKALAAGLGAALGGRKTIAVGELQGVIGAQLKKMSINVQTEAGSADIYNQLAAKLTGMITAALMTDGELSQDTEDQYGRYPEDPRPGTMRDRPKPPTLPAAEEGGLIRVAGMLDVLRRTSHMRINYENVGLSEQHVYTTSVLFKGEVQDPDVRSVNVFSGESEGRVLPNRLVRDNPISLSAVSHAPEQISYTPRTRYFTQNQLKSLRMHEKFPILRDEKLKIQDKMLKDGLVALMRVPGLRGSFTEEFYIWGMTEMTPSYKTLAVREIDLNLQTLKVVPIVVNFSKVGARKFKLAELLGDNKLWKAEWDDIGGKVVLTPKANLGQITIWNVEPTLSRDMVKRWYFQELRNPHKIIKNQRVDEAVSSLPISRSMIRVQVSEEDEVVGVIRPIGTGNANSGILVPSAN